jgi:hypothetical protein
MFSDADHEVIDSPEALFRHLYEEHGVEEARDLDPDTAPLQLWLRRHADLERAQRAARRQPDQPQDPPPPPQPQSPPRRQPERGQPERRTEPSPQPARAQPPPPDKPAPRAEPVSRAQPAGGGREGRRPAGFGDPMVEAMARALAGRGHDEVGVRSAIRSFADPGRGPAGEAAVRSVFVEPMLQLVAERLLGAPRSHRPAQQAQPAPAAATTGPPAASPPPRPSDAQARSRATPPAPPAREEPVRPEAAWAVLWADLADTGRRPGAGPGAAGDDGDDLMAVANAVQASRRVRLLRR